MKNCTISPKFFAIVIALVLLIPASAQNVGINSTAASPDASAMLDVVSTSKGLLIPRVSLSSLTDASTISSPATSLLVYNSNAALSGGVGYYYNSGTTGSPTWTRLVTSNSSGVTTIGGASDYTKFEADGTMEFNGAATVWDDVMVFPDGTSRGGSNPPTWGTQFKNNSGSQGVFLWMFSEGTEQELYFTVQIPHGYKIGSTIYPHVHWTSVTGIPSGTNVVWGLEYTVVAVAGAFPTTQTLTANSVISAVGTPSGTGQHLITALGSISGSGVGISTVFVCRVYRKAADAADTFGNSVGLLGIDFHIEKDTYGSRSDFTK